MPGRALHPTGPPTTHPQAGELGEDAGALQKALASFISAEPKGVVLLANLQQVGGRGRAGRAPHQVACHLLPGEH